MMQDRKDKAVWLSEADDNRFSSIKESKHYVVFPWLVDAVVKRKPAIVLDYGAGDGRFLESLRKKFDGELWHYDPSETLREIAKERLAGWRAHFLDSPQAAPAESVDIAVSTAVWMTIGTHEGCVDYLKAQFRLLKPKGRAFVVVTHPCFREEKYSTFNTDFDDGFYLNNGLEFSVSVFDARTEVSFSDYHWNLSAMLDQASEAGFRLVALAELPDVDAGNKRGAPWLVFDFGKD